MQMTSLSQRRSPKPLDRLTRRAASSFITIYQKQLSPRKGFSCALRVLHHSESCSQYTKRVIAELGIGQALPLIQQRFQACKAANRVLKARANHPTTQPKSSSIRSATASRYEPVSRSQPQPWLAIQDEPLSGEPSDNDTIAPDDDNADANETQKKQRGSIGGGSFSKPLSVTHNDPTERPNQNNCSDWNCDAIDCASLGCDAIDCSSADWSAMDCGTADCNGFDCNGFDCSSLDCSSCDFGSCDCSG